MTEAIDSHMSKKKVIDSQSAQTEKNKKNKYDSQISNVLPPQACKPQRAVASTLSDMIRASIGSVILDQ